MKGPAIYVENLSLQLGRTCILDNMSFTIEAGSIHCFIGPNGGGKTSTLRCLLGQMPHKGTIRFEWHQPQQLIGYVPQLIELEKALPLTVNDFLTLSIQQRPAFTGSSKTARPIIAEALDRTGLKNKADLMIGSLSGGERQRLLFAQALIPEPSLLVLDEPMTSLDETGMQLFEALVLDFHNQGGTVLWVNHDLEQVSRISSSVTVIDKCVLAHGASASIVNAEMQRGVFRTVAQQT